MSKFKVTTVVGTRPEIIRLSRVIKALDKHDTIEHILIHTGQNYDYELNEIFFEDLELRKPDYFLDAAEGNASITIGKILAKIDPLLEKIEPDAMLVLGDTNSCLSAIPAKKRKIPIFHMEAGNRCFDQRVPEETNRKIVDHIADINLTYSSIAREYLLAEGIPANMIIKTGSPMYEVLNAYSKKIEESEILPDLDLKERKYFVVSSHREENVNNEKRFNNLLKILNKLAARFEYPIIVSTHPRTRNVLNKSDSATSEYVRFMKPMGFHDYIHLQQNAKVVLSDSGTISEESSILDFPALNIREAHERPEAMEEASVMMVGLNPERVMQGIEILLTQEDDIDCNFREVFDYKMPNVSEKVVRIILSHVDYVNRNVWGI